MKKLLILILSVVYISLGAKNSYAVDASLSLVPAKNTYKLNETFSTDINLSTGGRRVSAVDVYFTFDKDKLRLEEIKEGKIFNQYVGREIDNFLGKGAISGIVSSPEQLFNGTGTFVTLKFKTLKAGTASIVFKFTKGSKNDSNVADFDQKTDTLAKVENGLFIITGEEVQTESKIQTLTQSGVTPGTLEETLENNSSDENTIQTEMNNQTAESGDIGTGIGNESNNQNSLLKRLPSLTRQSFPVIIIGIIGIVLFGIGIFIFNRNQSSRY